MGTEVSSFPVKERVVRDRGGEPGTCPGTVVGHAPHEVLVRWDGQDVTIPYHPSLLILHRGGAPKEGRRDG